MAIIKRTNCIIRKGILSVASGSFQIMTISKNGRIKMIDQYRQKKGNSNSDN